MNSVEEDTVETMFIITKKSKGDVKIRKVGIILTIMFILLLAVGTTAIARMPNVFNVKNYGAVGDGLTLDTAAINKAKEACSSAGGGTVYFPAGTYLSGSIELKNNVTLYIDAGATILGAPNNINAYDLPDKLPFKAFQDFGHSHWKNSLIWGVNLENIAIIGHGTIDGGGMTRGISPPGGGNKTIGLKLCRNISITDITIKNAGHFAILTTGCDNLTIDRVKIDTNRDGINIDCCRNVKISNCTINSPRDDAICLKSSYALGYKRATEDVTITNCMVSGYKIGTVIDGTYLQSKYQRCGRIKFGTESNGGFKNIVISNCIFDNCAGLALEIVDGGIMENVSISNISMRDIHNPPIFIRLGNRGRGPNNPPVGKVRNIELSNILVERAWPGCGSVISGIPGHPIENVRLSNIRIKYKGGGTKEDARIVPPEKEKAYPEATMFGRMPSYGFYCRHVKGLEFHNVEVGFEKEDLRPAMVCNGVEGLIIDNFKAERAPGNESPIVLKDAKDVFVYDCSDFPAIKAQYEEIQLSKNKVLVGEQFSVTVRVTAKRSGLSKVDLFIDSKIFATEYVWLNADSPKEIRFSNLKFDTPGRHEVKAGKPVERYSYNWWRKILSFDSVCKTVDVISRLKK